MENSEFDAYVAVRMAWRVDAKELNATEHHVAAVCDQICVGLFRVDKNSWYEHDPTIHGETDKPYKGTRYCFDGIPADEGMRRKYIGKKLNAPPGSQNPISKMLW